MTTEKTLIQETLSQDNQSVHKLYSTILFNRRRSTTYVNNWFTDISNRGFMSKQVELILISFSSSSYSALM